MNIEIRTVETKADLKKFIFYPAQLHKDHKNWVPPIYCDEFTFLNPKKNKNMLTNDILLLLAYSNNKIVGRIMGIINRHYNETYHSKTGRFFYLESENNSEISHALIKYVEDWAKEKGMNKMIGPFGFSDKDPQGLMIEGFENMPVIATNYNFPYMIDLVEKEGYKKEIDCVSYKLPIPKETPDLYNKILIRILKNNKLQMLDFQTRLSMRKYIVPLFRLVNETYKNLYGFIPLDEKEMREFANRYLPILDPAFVKVVLDAKNNVIAFIIAMPDMNQGIIKTKGKIFPFGFLKILSSARHTKQLNLLLGAVKEEYRGIGFDVLLGSKIIESARTRGIEVIDTHLILETNYKMRAEIEKLGGMLYKRYRIYQKNI
ncbi:MAG TPA: GNAT family N-acetyltransferase [Bacteroidales bacterium]|nr:GNAT family N-acetyltransferase [Bacteroidales bacterium]HPS17423.1 GNAT family N-acetyltransferase [Bacteroidales bacterium]